MDFVYEAGRAACTPPARPVLRASGGVERGAALRSRDAVTTRTPATGVSREADADSATDAELATAPAAPKTAAVPDRDLGCGANPRGAPRGPRGYRVQGSADGARQPLHHDSLSSAAAPASSSPAPHVPRRPRRRGARGHRLHLPWTKDGGGPAGRLHRRAAGAHSFTATVKLSPLEARGRCFDLREVYDSVNATYFANQVQARIGWGRPTPRRRRRSIRLGVYDHRMREIPPPPRARPSGGAALLRGIHRLSRDAPPALPSDGRTGRHVHHPRAFRERERSFHRYSAAMAWEKEHLHELLRR